MVLDGTSSSGGACFMSSATAGIEGLHVAVSPGACVCPPNDNEVHAGENHRLFCQEINYFPQNPKRFTVIIFPGDFQRIAKLSAGERRGHRNYDVMVAAGMCLPLDI